MSDGGLVAKQIPIAINHGLRRTLEKSALSLSVSNEVQQLSLHLEQSNQLLELNLLKGEGVKLFIDVDAPFTEIDLSTNASAQMLEPAFFYMVIHALVWGGFDFTTTFTPSDWCFMSETLEVVLMKLKTLGFVESVPFSKDNLRRVIAQSQGNAIENEKLEALAQVAEEMFGGDIGRQYRVRKKPVLSSIFKAREVDRVNFTKVRERAYKIKELGFDAPLEQLISD